MTLNESERSVATQGDAPLTRRSARAIEAAAAAQASTPPSLDTPRVILPVVASPSRRTGEQRPSSGRPAAARASLRTRVSKKLLSVGGLLFAGALLVGTTVPANAFMSDPIAFEPGESVTEKLPAQSIAVPGEAAAEPTSRDGYEVISYAEQLKELYTSSSYVYSVTSGSVRWPFPFVSPYTDGFGARGGFHMGVDFTPGEGSPIYAIADGIVTSHVDDFGSYGNHVILSHNVNGQRVDSLYAHMITGSSPLQPGSPIKVGDFIGLVGNTGQSYGAHLHLEIRLDGIQVDPFSWLGANAN
jgi:murein DD-endopeptidase MepM/ murein hydrolase activator NlpD